MSYITAIGTANPRHRFSQSAIAEFMLRAMEFGNGEARKLKTVFRASGIDYRHSVLEDYGKVEGFSFFPDTPGLAPFPSTEKRLQVFRQHALALSSEAAEKAVKLAGLVARTEITHLIVVCCTGMYAPGLDIELVHALGLRPSVERTAINFMGCHAAFNALKVADAACRSNADAKVMIVCTELCSLHFQRAATDDNLLANALFADGSAAVLVEPAPRMGTGLLLENFHSDLAPDGEPDMAWTIGDVGFRMRLSSYVPQLIKRGIGGLVGALLTKTNLDLSQIQHFAIHPGGKKILQVIEEELSITREQNAAAYDVLRNFGNMSSATVLFVLSRIFSGLTNGQHGERVLSVAFGPGLTLESMVLKIEKQNGNA